MGTSPLRDWTEVPLVMLGEGPGLKLSREIPLAVCFPVSKSCLGQ